MVRSPRVEKTTRRFSLLKLQIVLSYGARKFRTFFNEKELNISLRTGEDRGFKSAGDFSG
jgi:hypothetical protein